jgi:hypothetical protein
VKLAASDVTFGRLERPNDLKDPFDPSASRYNAVRVIAQRTTTANGPIDLTLARLWGLSKSNVSASAVAILDDRMAAYEPPAAGRSPLIPVTLLKSKFESEAATGPDEYGYDPVADKVTAGPDEVPEVHIYPDNVASGNFGLLNIGTSNQSGPGVAEQIENGVSQRNLMDEIGQARLEFTDDGGISKSYLITGDTGIKASLQKSFDLRIGEIVGIPLNSTVVGNGSNATFTIIDVRFGRLMEANLSGKPKTIILQPVLNGMKPRRKPFYSK